MEFRLNIGDITQPDAIVQLNRAISTIADECDTLYTTTAPNGAISARIGRRAIYNNSGAYTSWVNTDGGTTWVRIQDYDANILSIANPKRGDIAEYGSGGWIGLSVTTANSGMYVKSAGFGADPIYSLLNGSAMTGLSSIPGAAGVIPIANLATGTPDGTKFVRDDGTLAVPSSSLSNVIFEWTGQTDAAGAGMGVITSTSTLSDTGAATGQYLYIKDRNAGSSQTTIVLRSKFRKAAGINTLTVYASCWLNGASSTVAAQLNVNGSTIDTATTNSTSPTWINSTTLDVSALSNGTVYDMSIAIKSVNGAAVVNAYLGAVKVFAS